MVCAALASMLIASRAEAGNPRYCGKLRGTMKYTTGHEKVTIEIGPDQKKLDEEGWYIYIPRKGKYAGHASAAKGGVRGSYAWVSD